jgi:hypothetical protein
VTLKGVGEGHEGRVVLDRAPDGQRDSPTGDEHAMGLAQRPGLVGEELQPLLTADQVEGCVGQRQPGRIRRVPLEGAPPSVADAANTTICSLTSTPVTAPAAPTRRV